MTDARRVATRVALIGAALYVGAVAALIVWARRRGLA